MLVCPTDSRLLQLDAIKTAELDGGSLRLFKNDFVPNKATLLADLTPADFDGYAAKTIVTWGAAFLDPAGLATTLAPLQTWTQSGDTTPNTIYGAYYVSVGGDLIWAERFATSIGMADATSVLNMVPKFQSGDLGEVIS